MSAITVNQATIDLVKRFEGLGDGDEAVPGLQPYICPAGYWTIGYGRVVRTYDGRMLKGEVNRKAANDVYPDGIDAVLADLYLQQDLAEIALLVRARIKVPVTANQIGACVSFAYNVGVPAFAGSTLLRRMNAGDYAGAADQFLRWDKATDPRTGRKVVLPGLPRRRQAERALFLTGV
ncbi:MAG: lysozyme [Niveispirillum sp.]|uniref:lysozyme n=1 Tax=Niveispirillum sp. TaxID=1917217 RepID=UPI003BA6A470